MGGTPGGKFRQNQHRERHSNDRTIGRRWEEIMHRQWLKMVALAGSSIMFMAAGPVSAATGHAAAGFHGGGYHGGYGGYRGGYGGWHGGYGGWRGGWYGPRGWYGGWYGWGLGAGLFLATLPWYYTTYWWNGVPYYYADNVYYQWNDGVAGYTPVQPPAGLTEGSAQPAGQAPAGQAATPGPSGGEPFMYPKGGQSGDQQARDRDECRRWAGMQTGTASGANPPPPELNPDKRADYLRAERACLEGRNYSVQ
jgi:hypothetical protein